MLTTDQRADLEPPAPGEIRYLLTSLLSDVSRSFYLTLRAIPAPLRLPVGLAYLLARAADTIADSEMIGPDSRLENLIRFRNQFKNPPDADFLVAIKSALAPSQGIAAEQTLLEKIDRCFALLITLPDGDRELVSRVVETLTTGMEKDLRRFSGRSASDPGSLQTAEDLDEYTYLVAGCVGPFWTRIGHAHLPSLSSWDLDKQCMLGVRFGKALQLTNILRDLPRDLRSGRCYLPSRELSTAGLTPSDLLNPANEGKVRPVVLRWLRAALDHYEAAWQYTLSIPRRERRLRLACIWPIWIGLKTISRLSHTDHLLDADAVHKITRREVYNLMLESFFTAGSDWMINRRFIGLFDNAKPTQ